MLYHRHGLLLLFTFGLVSACIGFTNPIKSVDGSDPFMVYHDGYYYLTSGFYFSPITIISLKSPRSSATTWTNVQISRGATMQELKSATPKVIWSDSTASRCCNVWAPEIHWKSAEGAWYIYYVAGTSDTLNNQHIHVLRGSSTDIWASTWSYETRIVIPNRDVWAIDPTVLITSAGEYLVYSSWDGDYQCLYISKFSTATTVGDTVQISCPTQPWEQYGNNVEEAPLYDGGKTWIIYSASTCASSNYSLGQLELTGSDPLSPSSWKKVTSGPVFKSANGLYGTGHNGFFSSASSNETWLVYHFTTNSGGACDGSRETAVQPIHFSSSIEPIFGKPDSLSQAHDVENVQGKTTV
ncbi:glycoside hydrolase family 43 protein [Piloderma croceum F 1598]|uniref:Glycoside hydrolase family 43 protein n=1 Tax=Piloderma croceum (strain F 1598) TaxID=765440 RepID=A0A0C3ERS3_PILCF|nr:glycoside hydrolase family 43 protein [Piloderma croceum F 1598]